MLRHLGGWALVLALGGSLLAADPPAEGYIAPPAFEPVSFFAPFGNCCGSTPRCKNWWAVPAGAQHLAWQGYCGDCNFQQPIGGCGDTCESWTPMLGLSRFGLRRRGPCGCGDSCSGHCGCASKPGCDSKPDCAARPVCGCPATCDTRPACTCPASCGARTACPSTCDERPTCAGHATGTGGQADPFGDDPPPVPVDPMPMPRPLTKPIDRPPPPAPTDEPAPLPPLPEFEPVQPMKARSLRPATNDRTAAATNGRHVAPVGYLQANELSASPIFRWIADEPPAAPTSSRRVRPAQAATVHASTVPAATVQPASAQVSPAPAVEPAGSPGNVLRLRLPE